MSDKNKRRKSVILMIVCAFWLCYVAVTAGLFYANVKNLADKDIQKRQSQMRFVQESFIPLLVTENYSALKERLEQSRSIHLIDFYIIQKNGDVIEWYNNFDNLEGINVTYKVFNQIVETNSLAFRSVKIQDTTFTVGVFQDKNRIIWKTAVVNRNILIWDITIVTLVVTLVTYLFLKDIISLSKILASRSRNEIAEVKARSAEAETILKASMGLESERVRLEKVSETYSETIGPAILHELKSGKEAPYSFSATLCRIDLNGYTQMFLEKDHKYLTDILNQYFAKAREVIERYNGLIYQFVGDEIVFLFKDEMSQDLSSESLAIACIRDLFYEASVIESNLPPEAGHYFKLKGSFAKGTMRFIKLDEGHAISGLPLIESVRLLSLIDDKTHQILMFFQDAIPSAEGLAFIFDRKMNQLKGFKEESLLCRARDFNSIEWVFDSNHWERLAYFRHDTHMIFVLKKVRLMAVTRRDDDIVRMLTALKHHKFTNTTAEIVSEAEMTLTSFVRGEEEGLLSTKALSAVVTLMGRIIPKDLWNNDLQDSIVRLLEHKDPRVQANAIMVLGQYGYPARKIWENMFSQSNRVAADTIVEVAKQQVNADVWDALHRLLSSPHPNYRKSGEYALEHIISYYKETDPVFLQTNPILGKMQSFSVKKTA